MARTTAASEAFDARWFKRPTVSPSHAGVISPVMLMLTVVVPALSEMGGAISPPTVMLTASVRVPSGIADASGAMGRRRRVEIADHGVASAAGTLSESRGRVATSDTFHLPPCMHLGPRQLGEAAHDELTPVVEELERRFRGLSGEVAANRQREQIDRLDQFST